MIKNKKFYISDLHFRHPNILKFDNRPWSTLEEMEETLIHNWNGVVGKSDDVYVLGDFIWSAKSDDWLDIVDKLNGRIHLILGNHDIKNMSTTLRKKFASISTYKEVKDNGKRVLLSHYPMPFYRGDYNDNIIHLYGHLHTTIEEAFMQHLKNYILENDTRTTGKHKCNFYNVGCMLIGYTPRTLDEIIKIYET